MPVSKLQRRAAFFGILLVALVGTEVLDRYQPSSFSLLLKVIVMVVLSCSALYFAIVNQAASKFTADDVRRVREHITDVITKKLTKK